MAMEFCDPGEAITARKTVFEVDSAYDLELISTSEASGSSRKSCLHERLNFSLYFSFSTAILDVGFTSSLRPPESALPPGSLPFYSARPVDSSSMKFTLELLKNVPPRDMLMMLMPMAPRSVLTLLPLVSEVITSPPSSHLWPT